MAAAHTNKTSTTKYRQLFHVWLEGHGFIDIDKADRQKAVWMVEHWAELKPWLDNLDDGKRRRLNHPSSVWQAYKKYREQKQKEAEEQAEAPTTGSNDALPDHEPTPLERADAEVADLNAKREAVKWHLGLLKRVRKARGDIRLGGLWAPDLPPGEVLISAVDELVKEAIDLQRYLHSIRHATSAQLAEARADYAKGQKLKKQRKNGNGRQLEADQDE